MLKLTLKDQPTVPLEAEVLTPDHFSDKSLDAIKSLPVFLGKRQLRVDDFFTVEGEPSDELELHGDLAKVKYIGRAMTRGRIKVHGNVGMHLGASMKGGGIEVTGNASDWVGGEMTGGLIRVHGNAGGQVGAAYRGSLSGMNNGTILIGGTAGLEVGMRMKRGLIAIGGQARDFCGLQMKGGTILLMNGAEIRTGAWMIRGTIISLKPIKLLPTFNLACTYSPTVVRLIGNHVATLGLSVPTNEGDGAYQRYSGDSSVPGKGEILVWQARAAG